MELPAETIPDDIRKAAFAVAAQGYDESPVEAIARALLAERLSATERAAKIADRWKHRDTGYDIAAAIRSQP